MIPIPPRLKLVLKQQIRRYKQWRFAFGPEQLDDAIRRVGIAVGDTVLLHSSYDSFIGFNGKVSDILTVLRSAVGESGHLIVPTIPFAGTAIDYVRSAPIFNTRRTPSQMGLISEMCRRFPGAVRSTHPTHAVAVIGPNAKAMVSAHHLAETPCALQTPYGRLLDMDGKILLLGVDIAAMTFFHTIEAILEPQMPMSPFTTERFELESLDLDGERVKTTTRLFAPSVSRRRDVSMLLPGLKAQGAWHEQRVGNLQIAQLRARDALQEARRMAKENVFCYRQ